MKAEYRFEGQVIYTKVLTDLAEKFDIHSMLEAMSVKFVRLKQYTVYPYYFHLIDLYIDNVLTHQRRLGKIEANDDGAEDDLS